MGTGAHRDPRVSWRAGSAARRGQTRAALRGGAAVWRAGVTGHLAGGAHRERRIANRLSAK